MRKKKGLLLFLVLFLLINVVPIKGGGDVVPPTAPTDNKYTVLAVGCDDCDNGYHSNIDRSFTQDVIFFRKYTGEEQGSKVDRVL